MRMRWAMTRVQMLLPSSIYPCLQIKFAVDVVVVKGEVSVAASKRAVQSRLTLPSEYCSVAVAWVTTQRSKNGHPCCNAVGRGDPGGEKSGEDAIEGLKC